MKIVFDLDGTLADCTHRLPLIQCDKPDWDAFYGACVLDAPIYPVLNTLRALQYSGSITVEIWTGRSDLVRDGTERWLANLGLFCPVRMRSHGDHTSDDRLKESWLLTDIKLGYEKPDLVFEDRQRVVDMWRRNDVTCCQVAPGGF